MVRWCYNSQPLLERGVGGGVVVTMRKQDILIIIATTCCAAACSYLGWVLGSICFNIWDGWGVGWGMVMRARLACACCRCDVTICPGQVAVGTLW